MAAPQAAVSFDEIIQAERKRRHNAALAEEIFGKARKPGPHPPARGGRGRGSGVPSLASRVGVTKSSSFSNPRKPTNPFHATNNQAASQNKHLFPRAAPGNTRYEKRAVSASRLENITDSLRASNSNSQDISFRSSTTTPGNGISIRGTASGPFVVVARNFAAGTTVADIESTMTPVGGDITSCRITRDVPNVVAEIAFADKAGADTVIANFDKLRADGRILELYYKNSTPRSRNAITPTPVVIDDSTSQSQRSSVLSPQNFTSAREAADSSRRDRERRFADPEVQDGSYGFMDVDDTPAAAPAPAPNTSSRRQPRDRDPEPRDRDRERDTNRDRELFREPQQSQTPNAPAQDRSIYTPRSDIDRNSRLGENVSNFPTQPSTQPYRSSRDSDRGYYRGDRSYGRGSRRYDNRTDNYENSNRGPSNDQERNGGAGADMDVDVERDARVDQQQQGQESRQKDTRGRLYSDEIVRGDGRGSGSGGGGRGSWRGREYGR